MITTLSLVNIHLHKLYNMYIFSLVLRRFRIYSLSTFQIHYTAVLIYTVLYVKYLNKTEHRKNKNSVGTTDTGGYLLPGGQQLYCTPGRNTTKQNRNVYLSFCTIEALQSPRGKGAGPAGFPGCRRDFERPPCSPISTPLPRRPTSVPLTHEASFFTQFLFKF